MRNNETNTWNDGGLVKLSLPNNPIVPLVIVDAPMILAACDDAPIDISRSQNSGIVYFTFAKFEVSIEPSCSTAEEHQSLQNLKNFLDICAKAIVSDHLLLFVIPKELLLFSKRYSITLKLGNLLRAYGQHTFTLQKSDSFNVPKVVLRGPQEASPKDLITLSADYDCYVCGKEYNISGEWEFIRAFASNSQPMPFSLSIPSKATSTVWFLPYTFPFGTFHFRFTVCVEKGDVKQVYSYDYFFKVVFDKISMSIAGGNRAVSFGVPFTLSVLFDSPIVCLNDFEYEWSCAVDSCSACESHCRYLNGDPLIIYSKEPRITLNEKLIEFGAYQFKVVARHLATGTILKTTVFITISQAQILEVTVPSTVINIRSQDKLIIPSMLSDTNAVVAYSWESLAECPVDCADKMQYFAQFTIRNPEYIWDSLIIPSNALAPGLSYCFRVGVKDARTGRMSFAFTKVQVRQEPRGGFCQLLNPAAMTSSAGLSKWGEAFIGCYGWVCDRDGEPLFYRAMLEECKKRSHSSDDDDAVIVKHARIEKRVKAHHPHALSMASTRALIEFITPKSIPDLEVYVEVSDSLGQRTVSDPEISCPPQLLSSWVVFREPSITSYQASNDANVGMAALASYTKAPQGNEKNILDLIESLCKVIATTHDNGNALMFLQALASIAADFLPLSLLVQFMAVLALLHSMMDNSAALQNTCYSLEMSMMILELTDSTVLKRAPHDSPCLASYRKLIESVESCVQRTLICGHSPYSASFALHSLSFGVHDMSSAFLCDGMFELPKSFVSSPSSSSCVKYRCGQMKRNIYRRDDSDLVDDVLYDFSISGLSNAMISAQSPIRFAMPISDDFKKRYFHEGSTVEPSCSFVDESKGTFDTLGCRTLSFNSTHVRCECSHLTLFAVGINKTTLSASKTSLALVISLSILLPLLVLFLIMLGIWAVRRKRRANQTQVQFVKYAPDSGPLRSAAVNLDVDLEQQPTARTTNRVPTVFPMYQQRTVPNLLVQTPYSFGLTPAITATPQSTSHSSSSKSIADSIRETVAIRQAALERIEREQQRLKVEKLMARSNNIPSSSSE